jgi:hypothetical protein
MVVHPDTMPDPTSGHRYRNRCWAILPEAVRGHLTFLQLSLANGLKSTRTVRIAIFALALAIPLSAARPQPQQSAADDENWTFHSLLPLGSMPLAMKPGSTGLTLMATAESPMFEGWRRITRNHRRQLVDASGVPVRSFPESIVFRVTASTRSDRVLPFDRPDPIPGADAEMWLKNLSFRLKIFSGVEAREIEPASTKHLGMPPDVPYDERIYLVSFDVKDVPCTDRLVLEVFGPDGTRVGRFHLELL